MSSVVFLIFLVLLPGILFAFAECRINMKSKILERRFVYDSIFCWLSLIVVSSFIKTITGKGNITFFETLDYLTVSSFKHYFFINIVILVAMIVASMLLKNDDWIELCRETLLLFVAIFVVAFCFFGKIPSNGIFTTEYVIALILAFANVFLLKKESSDEENRIVDKIKSVIPISLMWVIINYIYIPGELFLSNVSEIRLKYRFFLVSCLLIGIATIIILCIIAALLPERILAMMQVGIFAVSLATYLQHMLLNGKLRSLDGTYQKWDYDTVARNIVMWSVLLAAIFVAYLLKNSIYRLYCLLAICISAMLILTTAVLAISTDQSSSDTLTSEGALEVSAGNNVIVFILDWYDTQFADKILEESPNFFDELSDFTYYDDVASLYEFTYMSVPYLLTGVKWQPDVDESYKNFTEYAFSQSSFLKNVNENGYSVGIYTEPTMVDKSQSDVVMNYSKSPKQKFSIYNNASLALQTSKYLGMPFLYKNSYAFNTYDYMNLLLNDDGWVNNDDRVFYNRLINQKLCVDNQSEKGAFRFYHLYGVHSPFTMTEDFEMITEDANNYAKFSVSQAKGAMKIVYEYLHQLDELGLYDDATIIITADHGQNYIFLDEADKLLENSGLDKPSSPILFVKMPGQKSKDGNLRHDSSMVTHELVIDIMRKAMNIQDKVPNPTFVDYEHERIGIYECGKHKWAGYKIDGSVHEWNNWKFIDYNDIN